MSQEPKPVAALGDLAWLGVDDLGGRLRSGALTSVQLARTVLDRIEQFDPVVNTFVTVMATEALEAAATADAELARGDDRGPIHGLPVGIKDAIDVAGVRCTFGSLILGDREAQTDAAVIRALRSAGAVIVGKQNLHEFAYGITGENPHFGDTCNPWDPARVAGGSSSGTAASIAAGLVPMGVGTDTGGSIRIPAAMCGVVGLKPTYGLVSRQGVLPLAWSLDHVGPIARNVFDCIQLLDAMVEPADERGSSAARGYTRSVRDAAEKGTRGVRIGIPRHHFFEGVEPPVMAAVRRAVDVLDDLGAQLVDVALPHAVQVQAAATPIMGGQAATWHAPWLRERADDYGTDVLQRLRQGASTSAVEYLEAQELRTVLQREFLAAFETVDVIVSPTVPVVAPFRGRTFDPTGTLEVAPRSIINRLTVPANMTGMPAMTVPCGRVDGLPVGLQLMGPPHGEAIVGTVALAYERSAAWHEDRPAVAA
jgi:aspartyl-tRNA(Asn)/glutamyl-tRNA(Gln) amidotransferase subunit A